MIFFLYGQDNFRAKEKLGQIKEKYLEEVDQAGSSLTEIDAAKISARELMEAAGTGSLFAKKRLVVISGLSQNSQEETLKEALRLIARDHQAATDSDILVFIDEISEEGIKKLKAASKTIFQELAKEKYAQEFKPLQGRTLINWISQRFQAVKIKIEPNAAQELADTNSGDLWKLSRQINQLANYCREKGKIEKTDIETFLKKNFEADIFALTDALGRKDRAQALKLLEQQLQAGLAEEYILAMIAKHFENLARVKIARHQGADPSKLGLHPFVMKKCLVQADGFSLNQIKEAVRILANLEKAAKTNTGQIKAGLSLFIASV